MYPIEEKTSFVVKDTRYTLDSLIRNRKIARHFQGGYAVILRLTVDDYHRYCYFDDGIKSENHRIDGVYHTVNPIANDHVKIYKENAEICIDEDKTFWRCTPDGSWSIDGWKDC